MPMTPFHMILAAPAKASLGKHFNATAFVVANIAMDIPIIHSAFAYGDVAHSPANLHTWVGAIFVAIMLWAILFQTWVGLWSVLAGTLSHIAIDGLIYPEMGMFGTPLAGYGGWLELGLVLFGALGAAILWHRHPHWWQHVGIVDVLRAIRNEMRFGNFFAQLLGWFLAGIYILGVLRVNLS